MQHETGIITSTHAFRTPHTVSQHRSTNTGNCERVKRDVRIRLKIIQSIRDMNFYKNEKKKKRERDVYLPIFGKASSSQRRSKVCQSVTRRFFSYKILCLCRERCIYPEKSFPSSLCQWAAPFCTWAVNRHNIYDISFRKSWKRIFCIYTYIHKCIYIYIHIYLRKRDLTKKRKIGQMKGNERREQSRDIIR